MNPDTPAITTIQQAILTIRDQKVMLDRDLAVLYGVSTKRLNEQVKRNRDRFPGDFMFRLTKAEKEQVVAICDHLGALRYSRTNPFAFTEHGAVMVASILSTPQAVQTSILVVRAFVHFRALALTHKELTQRIEVLEKKFDRKFSVIFQTLRHLIETPQPTRKPIGFRQKPIDHEE